MKYYLLIAATAIMLGTGVYLGYRWFGHTNQPATVNSQTIVTMLKQEGFLVTQTYIFNQKITIKRDSGSVWKDFFWGQDITALANMKVSSGVDLNKLSVESITVNDHTLNIELPNMETHSVEVIGDITLQNNQGILKRVFNNDDGYNAAYQALQKTALEAAATSTLRAEAEASTQKEVTQLLTLVSKDRKITITFKQ